MAHTIALAGFGAFTFLLRWLMGQICWFLFKITSPETSALRGGSVSPLLQWQQAALLPCEVRFPIFMGQIQHEFSSRPPVQVGCFAQDPPVWWVPNGRRKAAGGKEYLLQSITGILSMGLCWEVGEQGEPCSNSIAIPNRDSCCAPRAGV